MHKIDSSNTLFSLAADLVNHTARHIFLTGKAGTGKTTFLKYIKETTPKKLAIVAPTGVAAINAGGVTIHSFFQLPFTPFIPEARGFVGHEEEVSNKHTLIGRLRLNSERRKVLQELELLVIDEISMVRADVLDAIDLVLRHFRNRHTDRFGGVQVLFIGDLFQLPPVVKDDEWNVLSDYYRSPFFFDSIVIKEEPPVYIEFTKIYRQTEEVFINLLNKVRNNQLNDEDLQALHHRYQPEFFGEASDNYILLTTHNEKAREINKTELARLEGESSVYKATVDGDFPASAHPAEEELVLKIGAQVMFIKNDTDKGKRYFNGKIGRVTECIKDKVFVQCNDDQEAIEVSKEVWENIRYTVDKSTRDVTEDVLGSFTQFPLRLAWAITIHKSQGLTFEKAVIDAGKAFAPGQVYVALSRCTTLEGIVLHSRINRYSLSTDERIGQFTRSALPLDGLKQELALAKKDYQQKILLALFDFIKPINSLRELYEYISQHTTSFNEEVLPWLAQVNNKLSSLQSVAQKFHLQLSRLFGQMENIEENPELLQRLQSGSIWFLQEIKALIESLTQSPAVTDSTMHAKEYNELLREAFIYLNQQGFLLHGLDGQFDMEALHRRKRNFSPPAFGVNAYAGSSDKKVELAHPSLYYQLKKLRDNLCSKRNLPIYLVASSKTLEEMANYLPQTVQELEQITGFGKAKVETYGKDFLSIIQEYAQPNGLPSNLPEKSTKRKKREPAAKVDTKAETLRLFKEGKSVTDISKERALTTQTIEGHLAHYVQEGEIKIDELVSTEKVRLIEQVIKSSEGLSVTGLKEKLGNSISFGEIRLVLAWVEHQKSSSHVHH